MNKQPNPDRSLLHFMLRAQQIAQQDGRSDRGYAMLIVSLVSIAMFSMLAAYMTITNLSKSSTNAYVDGTNTFYAAESGLNKRAQQVRDKFVNYSTPTGTQIGGTTSVISAATISNCFTVAPGGAATSNDFECRNYSFRYNNNIAATKTSQGETVIGEQDDNRNSINYVAYTFVADITKKVGGAPPTITIGSDETFGGLRAQEYQYTVYATANANQNIASGITPEESAAKIREKVPASMLPGDPTLISSYDSKLAAATTANNGRATSNTNTNTVLQMNFKSRIIPIFQFGAFYDGDLEFNPSPLMTFNGRLHSNGNMYMTAGDSKTLTIDGIVTAVGTIYSGNPSLDTGYSAGGQVLITKSTGVTQALPANTAPTSTAVAVTSLSSYNAKLKDRTTPVTRLTLPNAGLLSKLDPNQSDGIGEYYGKADLRLEMYPDRAVPFGLQVISSGTGTTTTGAGVCSGAGNVFNNTTTGVKTVSEGRGNYSTAKCNDLKEGQLRSLMQPVLVRPRSTLEYTTFCTTSGAGTSPQPPSTTTTLIPTTPVSIGTSGALTTSTTPTDLAVKERILDALALTLAAQPAPVNYSSLTGSLSASAKLQFRALLDKITTLGTTDKNTLQDAAPTAIAALSTTATKDNSSTPIDTRRSCFRPAPIQVLFNPTDFDTAAKRALNTETNFNDRRENRFIRMIQTNLESLTLWNRDGLFVQENISPAVGGFNGILIDNDTISATDLATKFTIDAVTLDWSERAASSGNNVLFYKDIARTLEADGTTAIAAQSYRGMGLAAVDRTEGGLVIHATINQTTYPYTAFESPYGFSFNDAANLPGPLTVATDQAVYSQGDWNRYDKQPASLLADSLSLLSNNCLASSDSSSTAIDPAHLQGQLNCGKKAEINVASETTVNAAFLARTDRSTATYYSGGLNNYMRILEKWSGKAMNYRGSFVSLGIPQQVKGQYLSCTPGSSALGVTAATYGCPPDRFWGYDTDFDTFSKLPPLSPRVIELRQDVFKRSYQ
jgi:Tfp pilus assembly protein PilX